MNKKEKVKLLREHLINGLNSMTVKELDEVRSAIIEYGIKSVVKAVVVCACSDFLVKESKKDIEEKLK